MKCEEGVIHLGGLSCVFLEKNDHPSVPFSKMRQKGIHFSSRAFLNTDPEKKAEDEDEKIEHHNCAEGTFLAYCCCQVIRVYN